MLAQVNHVAQFYATDTELVDAIAGLVRDAAGDGGTAIVIATPEHVSQVAYQLEPGVAAQVQFLDAAETLSQFDNGRRLDHRKFDSVIGNLVRAAARRPGPIHAYGEMVALLWQTGRVTDALELEQLWNELARTVPFSLRCGYPATTVSHDEATTQLYSLHSAVVGANTTPRSARTATRRFDPTVGAIRAARAFVVDQLREWGHDDVLDNAKLVTSELVTNSVLHARSAFDVSISSEDGLVTVVVRDASHAAAVRDTPMATATSGRGLLIVDALAQRWDSEISRDGKRVWAELRC